MTERDGREGWRRRLFLCYLLVHLTVTWGSRWAGWHTLHQNIIIRFSMPLLVNLRLPVNNVMILTILYRLRWQWISTQRHWQSGSCNFGTCMCVYRYCMCVCVCVMTSRRFDWEDSTVRHHYEAWQRSGQRLRPLVQERRIGRQDWADRTTSQRVTRLRMWGLEQSGSWDACCTSLSRNVSAVHTSTHTQVTVHSHTHKHTSHIRPTCSPWDARN